MTDGLEAPSGPAPWEGKKAEEPTPELVLPPSAKGADPGKAELPEYAKTSCHRSWLMVPVPQRQSALDPRTQKLVESVIMVPNGTPFRCIGPLCKLWSARHAQCRDVVESDLRIAQLEAQAAAVATPVSMLAPDA